MVRGFEPLKATKNHSHRFERFLSQPCEYSIAEFIQKVKRFYVKIELKKMYVQFNLHYIKINGGKAADDFTCSVYYLALLLKRRKGRRDCGG